MMIENNKTQKMNKIPKMINVFTINMMKIARIPKKMENKILKKMEKMETMKMNISINIKR